VHRDDVDLIENSLRGGNPKVRRAAEAYIEAFQACLSAGRTDPHLKATNAFHYASWRDDAEWDERVFAVTSVYAVTQGAAILSCLAAPNSVLHVLAATLLGSSALNLGSLCLYGRAAVPDAVRYATYHDGKFLGIPWDGSVPCAAQHGVPGHAPSSILQEDIVMI
jgi:hypothetical protein